MFNLLLDVISSYEYTIFFICNLIIFVGGLYVAVHSRIIPNWLVTCLWYVSLTSLLAAISIIIEVFLDSTHALAYIHIKQLIHTLPMVAISITILLMFLDTLSKDIANRKNRKDRCPEDSRL